MGSCEDGDAPRAMGASCPVSLCRPVASEPARPLDEGRYSATPLSISAGGWLRCAIPTAWQQTSGIGGVSGKNIYSRVGRCRSARLAAEVRVPRQECAALFVERPSWSRGSGWMRAFPLSRVEQAAARGEEGPRQVVPSSVLSVAGRRTPGQGARNLYNAHSRPRARLFGVTSAWGATDDGRLLALLLLLPARRSSRELPTHGLLLLLQSTVGVHTSDRV